MRAIWSSACSFGPPIHLGLGRRTADCGLCVFCGREKGGRRLFCERCRALRHVEWPRAAFGLIGGLPSIAVGVSNLSGAGQVCEWTWRWRRPGLMGHSSRRALRWFTDETPPRSGRGCRTRLQTRALRKSGSRSPCGKRIAWPASGPRSRLRSRRSDIHRRPASR
jgi:hypothetical protein